MGMCGDSIVKDRFRATGDGYAKTRAAMELVLVAEALAFLLPH